MEGLKNDPSARAITGRAWRSEFNRLFLGDLCGLRGEFIQVQIDPLNRVKSPRKKSKKAGAVTSESNYH